MVDKNSAKVIQWWCLPQKHFFGFKKRIQSRQRKTDQAGFESTKRIQVKACFGFYSFALFSFDPFKMYINNTRRKKNV